MSSVSVVKSNSSLQLVICLVRSWYRLGNNAMLFRKRRYWIKPIFNIFLFYRWRIVSLHILVQSIDNVFEIIRKNIYFGINESFVLQT